MTNQEKSRWLVENILGECWHEWVSYISDYPYYHYHCSYCKGERSGKELNIDFFTTDPDQQATNFFKLWNVVIERERFYDFISGVDGIGNYSEDLNTNCIIIKYIKCSVLAEAIGEYFKWGKREAL